MSLLEVSKSLLRKHRITPNKFLGQNFIIDSSIFKSMGEYASLDRDDVVLDIGAGLGFLTRFLAERCRNVLAVEADPKLVAVLCERLQGLTNVELIKGSVLKVQLPSFSKVVSIPPYQISSRLLLWLFSRSFDCAIAIFQKEFAERLIAEIGSEEYGWLTVLAYYHAEAELLDSVPKSSFHPQPEVDSVIVRLRPRKQPPFSVNCVASFRQMLRSLFTQRNRKVRNAMLPFLKGIRGIKTENATSLADSVPFHDKRIRELAPEDFGELANAFT
jgi:16S rRNA (adenine1518-N6/adenine1519-N6)-dimethyltransferase